jgi:catechol 2,3-dioxygenase-like lactoylglutathione lyase family enzyme
MVITGLRQIGLPAHDLDRAVAFYRDTLGLPFVARFGTLAFFDAGGVRILLEAAEESDQVQGAGVLYLAVDDIDGQHAELAARGIQFQSAPHAIFVDEQGTFGAAGETELMAFFRDSEGNQLALASRERR